MNSLQSKNKNIKLFLTTKEKLIRKVKFLFFVLLILIFTPNKVQAQAQVGKAIGELLENPPSQSLFSSHGDFQNILEEQNIKNLSQKQTEALAYASSVNDPIYLMRSLKSFFNSDAYKAFFFLHFDLDKHGDELFTHLFTKKVDKNTRIELDLPASQKNWEDFIRSLEEAIRNGQTQINQTDLEAAALTFIHTKLSPHINFNRPLSRHNTFPFEYTDTQWFGNSIAVFFHLEIIQYRYADLYMNPYFRLTTMDPYLYTVLKTIVSDSNSLDSKEIILKLWSDIKAYATKVEQSSAIGINAIHTRYKRSLIQNLEKEIKKSLQRASFHFRSNNVQVSFEEDPLLKALVEARYEDSSLLSFLKELTHTHVRNPNLSEFSYSLEEDYLPALDEYYDYHF